MAAGIQYLNTQRQAFGLAPMRQCEINNGLCLLECDLGYLGLPQCQSVSKANAGLPFLSTMRPAVPPAK